MLTRRPVMRDATEGGTYHLMRQRNTSHWLTMHAGSKTLAVLSCALALLAAYPVVARGEESQRPAVHAMAEGRTGATVRWPQSRPQAGDAAVLSSDDRQTARARSRAEAQQYWLTALERFGAYLAAELTDVTPLQPNPAGPVLTALPSYFAGLTLRPQESLRVDAPPPLPCERAFVMARCALAPPADPS